MWNNFIRETLGKRDLFNIQSQ